MNCQSKTIVWFRRDLRIEDNPALAAAARDGGILPVFIWCSKEEGQFYPGRASRWWLKKSLIQLEQSLRSLGAELILIKTQSTLAALLNCISAVGATKVVYNHLYDPVSLVRDHNIKQKLGDLGVSVQSYNGELLYEPWEVYDDKGHAFTTFDAFWNKCLRMQSEPASNLPPWRLVPAAVSSSHQNVDMTTEPWLNHSVEVKVTLALLDCFKVKITEVEKKKNEHKKKLEKKTTISKSKWNIILSSSPMAGSVDKCSVDELGLENESEKSSNALLGRGWSPGWINADKAFTEFVEHHLLSYSKNRHRVAGNSTSLLSPYLHFGELSIRKVFHSVHMKRILWAQEGNSVGEESATLFLRAIGLREYARYICFNFPFTHERSLLSNFKFFPWSADQAHFKAWRQGRTGYPLVDAGMRELWATGWIHNRIRVIVSSFFVKFLLLPWQWGMKYFWDTLLDADLESDILGWQYISGSLPDGHELERLDSPEVEGFKFDPEGEYVRHWLPELARMPAEWIHHPWHAPLTVLKAAGVELGLNYPRPIIDIDEARDRLTEAIFAMREKEAAARATDGDETDEVVFDNSTTENVRIPVAASRENVPCPTTSSHDQRVPSMQNLGNGILNKKRPKPDEDEKPLKNYWHNDNDKGEVSKMVDDLCSTAESSPKKQSTNSRTSFSVPQAISISSKASSLQENQSSDLKLQLQDEIGAEEPSRQTGVLES